MNITQLFNCPIPVSFESLEGTGTIGHYEPQLDRIVLCTTLQKDFPHHRNIIYLHEMFHGTGEKSRSYRTERLKLHFGRNRHRVEECIVEICTMVAMQKLNILTPFSRVIPEQGILDNYDTDIYIPWREIVSALEKFKLDEVNFGQDLTSIRKYLTSTFKLDIRDVYERTNNSST